MQYPFKSTKAAILTWQCCNTRVETKGVSIKKWGVENIGHKMGTNINLGLMLIGKLGFHRTLEWEDAFLLPLEDGISSGFESRT